jgi:hypothetical protein
VQAPPLPEARHLVDAALVGAPAAPTGDGRLVWLLDLFERLERRERARVGVASP